MNDKELQEIKFLISKGYSASKIAKLIKKNKQNTLKIVRDIKGVSKKENSFVNTPTKFLTEKGKARKERIIIRRAKRRAERKKKKVKLTKKDIKNLKELVLNNTPKYRILNVFSREKEKLILKEIKKIKKTIKKEQLKKLKKAFPKCKYNYRTISHIGYKFNKKVSYDIFIEMNNRQLNAVISDIRNKVNVLNNQVRCSKRMHYTSLEYTITFKDGRKDKKLRISTNISTGKGIVTFKGMLNQIEQLITYLDNVINRSESPKDIKIHNIYYVNYDFKGEVKNTLS